MRKAREARLVDDGAHYGALPIFGQRSFQKRERERNERAREENQT